MELNPFVRLMLIIRAGRFGQLSEDSRTIV